MKRFFVGIDLHMKSAQYCVLDEVGELVEEKRCDVGTPEEGSAFVERLKARRDGSRFVVEAVGMNRWFVNACRKEGLDIVVADPGKLGLKVLGKKTDRRDALELARRLRLGDIDRNAKTYYPTDEEYGVRKLLRTRHHLQAQRQGLVNQIRALLQAYLIAPPGRVLHAGRNLRALRELQLPTEEMTLCLWALVAAVEVLQAHAKMLSKRVDALESHENVGAAVEILPGVGPLTAATIIYELADVTRFRNAKAVASFAGLVPRVTQSGQSCHHGRLTKRGSTQLRWILCEWAVRLLARDPRVREWAQPQLPRLHGNKVRMALARRLLVGVYIMLRRGDVFSPERCLAG